MTFRETLPSSERHFAGRLEAFGDIVAGFSMSQLALQLDIPKTPEDVFGHASRYLVFFLAFGVVSVFWYRFHRIMSSGFAPNGVDVILLFAFLAFVALTPYALVTYMRLHAAEGFSAQGVMLYLGVFLGVVGFSWILSVRGMRRAWRYLDARQRRETWRAVVAGAIAIVVFAVALGAVILTGTRGLSTTIVLPLAVPLALRVFRTPPRWAVGPQADDRAGTLGAVNVS